ncbi:competence/damage-inducible protein A [Crenothrix polyspora]|uniref:Molybdopterin binding domain protein n=1 Tax=Crenothrix polyspora TaxID=360316 RepID=A0A1R4H5S3_9GAMM|nr:molybdopterin-binding protein [Crenothrix polyspora]SJM91381.1 Molybdopterin binding domain protein [Crenothrix polyspora]
MNPLLEIFSQGEEIIRGQITDTNATWLSQHSVQLGFNVVRHTAVGDKLADLVLLLQEIAQRADCCLCTGGLGPTTDDLTAEAVAKAFNLPLLFDDTAYAQIKQFFAHRGRAMPESNSKQAWLPTGAERLDNDMGTAPGFAVKFQRCWFAFMPGVPSEMQHMYLAKILPSLTGRFQLHPARLITLKTIGMGESAIQECIAGVTIPHDVQLGFRAAEDVQVKLLFPFAYSELMLRQLVADIAECLAACVYAIDGLGEESGDLVATLDKLMLSGGHRLAVLETASQGLLAAKCLGMEWLLSASYIQSLPRVATQFSLVPMTDDIIAFAKIIARHLQQQQGADFALVQLYAEQRDILCDKNQSIIVHTVLLAGDMYQHETHSIGGTLQRKQKQAALMSLDVLRRYFLTRKPNTSTQSQ